jgi:hypothetical protein
MGVQEVREDTVSRVGTLGHAFMHHMLAGLIERSAIEATACGNFHGSSGVIDKEHAKRNWPDIEGTYRDAQVAAVAALALHRRVLAAGYTTVEGMTEMAVEVDAIDAIEYLADRGFYEHPSDLAALLNPPETPPKIKCRIDAVMQGPDGLELFDWKFSHNPPSESEEPENLPDPQHSWYAFVLAVAGVNVSRGHRVTVHAAQPFVPCQAADLPRRKDGLPSLVHPPTTAEEFAKAVRISIVSQPIRMKHAESMDEHAAILKAIDSRRAEGPAIAARSHDLWPHHYLRLAHERLVAHATMVRTRLCSRRLRVYNGSPCLPYSPGRRSIPCPVRSICMANLNGQDLADAIDDAVRMGTHRTIGEKVEESTT